MKWHISLYCVFNVSFSCFFAPIQGGCRSVYAELTHRNLAALCRWPLLIRSECFYACADIRCVVPPPVLRVAHVTRRLALSSWAPGMPRCPRSSPQPEVDESQKPPQLPCPSVGMAPRHTLQAFEVFLDGWSSSCPQGCNLLQKAVFLAAFPSLSHFSASLWLFPGIIFQIYGLHSFPHSLLLGEPRPR